MDGYEVNEAVQVSSDTKKRKVSIIGAGHVGASIAYALMLTRLANELVLIDKDRYKAAAEAKDIRHGVPSFGSANIYAGDYKDCGGSDLIIVTAGRNRRPNESRLDLASDNVAIAYETVKSLEKHYTKGVVMVVSNPVDVIVKKYAEWMQLPDGVVFGTGCMLDTSRFVRHLADYVGVEHENIHGYICGEHGDAQVPVWSKVTVGGVHIDEYCRSVGLSWGNAEKEEISRKVKGIGTEIIRGKGRTHFGIATCVAYLADIILNERKIIASVSSTMQGEYGIRDVALSVPSLVGNKGVLQRIEEQLSADEINALRHASNQLNSVLRTI